MRKHLKLVVTNLNFHCVDQLRVLNTFDRFMIMKLRDVHLLCAVALFVLKLSVFLVLTHILFVILVLFFISLLCCQYWSAVRLTHVKNYQSS